MIQQRFTPAPWHGGRVDEAGARRGYRLLEHTADVALECWAPTRAECLAEAVRALASSFVDLLTASPSESFVVTFPAADDEGLLVGLLDEVIYLLDVFNKVPIDAEVEESAEDGLIVHFATATPDEIEVIGAVPKAVSLHQLVFGTEGDSWRCHVTIDV